jgi:hypothetical protein
MLATLFGAAVTPWAVARSTRGRMRLPAIAALLSCAVLAGCGSIVGTPEGDRHEPAVGNAGGGADSGARPLVLRAGEWRMRVQVEPMRSGPIRLDVGPARHFSFVSPGHRPAGVGRDVVQHDLILRNVGPRRVRFGDTRRSTFLGPQRTPPLLAADEGCGYSKNGSAPVHPGACLAYLDAIMLGTGGSARRTISVQWGLPGMGPLTRGTYVFTKPMRFRVERRSGGGERQSVLVRLTYEVRPAAR